MMFFELASRIRCQDGFEVSIQANDGAYCEPRQAWSDNYISFELGMPSEASSELMEYADNPKDPTGTIYGYVPRKTVAKLLESHGGVVALAPQSPRASNEYAKHLLCCVGIAREQVEALEEVVS